MCGRFALALGADDCQIAFPTFVFPDDVAPRYNIAPGQSIVAIANTGEHRADHFKWGLVPAWAKDPKIGNKMINARGETLSEKPAFRSAYKKRRCIVPLTGFYEWQKQPDGKGKVPMYIAMKSGAPFAMAGLWETWRTPEGDAVRSCTLITTEPNALMRTIHNRMPVILPPDAWDIWLSPGEQATDVLQPLLAPYPAEAMTAHPVSTRVNIPANDDLECLKPAWPPEVPKLF